MLLILQESVKFAPNALDGSLDAIILLGNSMKIHDPDYRDHMLVKPGGHIFTNIPDLQFLTPKQLHHVLKDQEERGDVPTPGKKSPTIIGTAGESFEI